MESIEFLKGLQQKYKRGWYRKGNTHRFLFAIDPRGMLLYQTKTAVKKNSHQITGVHPDFDKWFKKAEYVGLELEETE
ncbi:hypothetical protein IBQ18_001325 [Enterococcus hirae]|nr:hypothetical protein [Enterococcus hirae]EMF0253993.1 hypothetical protein [Enterococcus hirae]EMF0502983.1 hypothetical protein [Enterococcus hirae]EMF0624796.1 hypothetical protein [Enterococcus hirae]MBA5260476.1 hypothetical protein [Enterococcus hirae]